VAAAPERCYTRPANPDRPAGKVNRL
jgi:hypothetical protein